jgi:glycosyltransferase involved in cell wall biosynthesis
MILGVANVWEKRKGIDDYLELSQKLDESCVVVLVGLSQKQISDINQKYANIIALPKTNSAKELAKIYTAADVFVNLTYEDNYPTVNLEAEACGTPVITYDTGGCKETIRRSDSKVIPYGVDNVAEYIHEFRTES